MGLLGLDLAIIAWHCRQLHINSPRIATIGRQCVWIKPKEAAFLRNLSEKPDEIRAQRGSYCESTLKALLGSCTIDSIDANEYENCTIIHNMNYGIPDVLDGAFDIVIDGGSLEHIFNVPVAVANMVNMTKDGGLIYLANPSNNLCGHGFYQFSPEFYYRIAEAYDLDVIEFVVTEHSLLSVEKSRKTSSYSISDPKVVNSRIYIITSRPTMSRVLFRRRQKSNVLVEDIVQSD